MPMMTQPDDHDPDHTEGFAADLPHFLNRRLMLSGLAIGGAALSLWAVRGGAQTVTATGPDGALCVQIPAATEGPFPADGTNVREGQTVNILTESGVMRQDIRTSIGGLTPVAKGVPVTLEITLVDVANACAPLEGYAVYAWQCDAEGVYSIYAAQDRNYLRGVGVSDAQGRVRFTTIFPGCYGGRWPHIHYEVFADVDVALSGEAAVLTSQFALPEGECRAVYAANPLYAASVESLDRVSLARDGIFRRNSEVELAAQTLTLEGDPAAGYRATGRVGLVI
jgi:protocatechuate 3,4-dioxygenase beta subunit